MFDNESLYVFLLKNYEIFNRCKIRSIITNYTPLLTIQLRKKIFLIILKLLVIISHSRGNHYLDFCIYHFNLFLVIYIHIKLWYYTYGKTMYVYGTVHVGKHIWWPKCNGKDLYIHITYIYIYIYIYIYSIDNNKYSLASFLTLYERHNILCLLWFAHLFRILFFRLSHMHVAH